MHRILGHPVPLACLCIVLMWWLGQAAPLKRSAARWLLVAVLALLTAGMIGPLVCAGGHMLNLDEPTVLADAAAALHGQPLYTSPGAPEQYSLLYGPVSFWAYWPPMLAHVLDLRVYQLWVIVPLLGAGLLLYRTARRAGDAAGTTLALLPYAVAVLLESNHEWAVKGDPWMLLFLAAGLEAAASLQLPWALLLAALASALLIDTKVTAALLALMPALLVGRRFGKGPGALCMVLTGTLALAAFLVPGVSLRNYAAYLVSSTHHGINPAWVKSFTELLLFLGLPMLALLAGQAFTARDSTGGWLRARWLLLLSATLAALVAAITGAKLGAGPWHLVPVTPLFVWGTAALWRRSDVPRGPALPRWSRAAISGAALAQMILAIAALLVSVPLHLRGLKEYQELPTAAVEQDIEQVARAHPGTSLQMGYGDDRSFALTWARPVLVLLGNPYTLDADSLNETEMAGRPFPHAAVQAVQSCHAQLYLTPKDSAPFVMQNVYHFYGNPAPRDLFPVPFRQAFAANYQKIGSSRYFDLWACDHQETPDSR